MRQKTAAGTQYVLFITKITDYERKLTMEIFDLVLLSLGLAMDAFAVSVTNGMTIHKIKLKQAGVIALTYGVFQGIMPVVGYALGIGFSAYMESLSCWVALILLCAIGMKMIYEGFKCTREGTCKLRPFVLSLVLTQAVATSIDALMVGVTFVAVRAPLFIATGTIAAVTALISFSGVYIGKKFGDIFKSKSEILGGGILILIGIKIFLEAKI